MDDFERFWTAYPRKVAKAEARKAWQQTAGVRPETDRLIKAVIVAKSTDQWLAEDGKYIPHASTWLRGERWEDVHEVDLAGVFNGKMWWQTVQGVEQKAAELGMKWDGTRETYPQFRDRVRGLVESSNVVQMRGAS